MALTIKYKNQTFQNEAADAVCSVFVGQTYQNESSYFMDMGEPDADGFKFDPILGFGNAPFVPSLTRERVLANIQNVQAKYNIPLSQKIEGTGINLTVQMETGVGKTFTYIKTMYELNKQYGWSKFMIIVPSIAIREGVYKSFQTTEYYFKNIYHKSIRFFIYKSERLTDIQEFASDNEIHAMIINFQAFSARGKDARRIGMKLDSFQSRKPIDVIASTKPILIIDEPQSVEGKVTKQQIPQFKPLFILRYSATPKEAYNMVYQLDAVEAFNKKLVKKIAVKGIEVEGSTATEGYLYLSQIMISSEKEPQARIWFDAVQNFGVTKKSKILMKGDDLYDHSGHLEEYRNGYVITDIDGNNQTVSFINGIHLSVGDVTGTTDESLIHRIQIRETIRTHLERESKLYLKGIKVLSLFFIDEVAKYKQYIDGVETNGEYAEEFEQIYKEEVASFQQELGSEAYLDYLDWLSDKKVHAGYFAIDKEKHLVNPSCKKTKEGDEVSDDQSAFDLIMRNKEELLSLQNPVRFIFSHSALKEGWDNPNVFQICTLKKSSSDIRKRQEVGRGLRLCVNQQGERMDEDILGSLDVQNVNLLTVIANESYDSFAKGLQKEIAEVSADRPQKVKLSLFVGKMLQGDDGSKVVLDVDQAQGLFDDLRDQQYIEKDGSLSDKYTTAITDGAFHVSEPYQKYVPAIRKILDGVLNTKAMLPENAFHQNIELKLNKERFNSKEFQSLWNKIKAKTIYQVSFDPQELIANCIRKLDQDLHVTPLLVSVTTGVQKNKTTKEELLAGNAFDNKVTITERMQGVANDAVKFDLVEKMVEQTTMTRRDIVTILKGIQKNTFDQFKQNPEEFIKKAGIIINEQKGSVIIEHVVYHKLNETFSSDIFTDYSIRGEYGKNAMDAQKSVYNFLVTDSNVEKQFAKEMDEHQEITMYVKLPPSFFIETPVGNYNPDWAIVCDEAKVRHIYFVAETKGSNSQLELRTIEQTKIDCARKHFKEICGDTVIYDVVSDYQELKNILFSTERP